MPPPTRRNPYGVERADGMFDVTTADGRSIVLPRDMAERAGVADFRPMLADLGAVDVPEGAPMDPALLRAAEEARGVADVPMSTMPDPATLESPDPGGAPPMTSAPQALDPSQIEVPVIPQPGAAAVPAQIEAYRYGGLPAVDALNASQAAPGQPQAVPVPRGAAPTPTRFVTADGRQVAPGAAPAPRGVTRAAVPLGSTPTDDPWGQFGSRDPLEQALTQRPADAPPIAPQDFRQDSPMARQEQRIDRDRRRAQELADAQTAAAIDREDLLAREEQRQAEISAQRDVALARAERQMYDAIEEARAATVNPTRLYQNGGGVLMAIATAVGQLASGITGGPNAALQIIDRAIDRDITAQTTNQANAQRTVQNRRTFFDMTRQRFQDQEAAARAARALAWDQVAQRLEASTASLQGAAAQDEAAALIEQARAQAAQQAAAAQRAEIEWQMDRAQQSAEIRKLEAEATRAERRAGGGGSGAGDLRRRAQLARSLEQAGYTREAALREAGLDPSMAAAEEGELSGQERTQVAALETALDNVERLVPAEGQDIPGYGLFDGMLPNLLAGDAGRELRQAVENLTELYGRLHSGGAISDDEFQLFSRVIGSGRWQTEAELRRGLTLVRNEIRARRSGSSAVQQPAPLPAGVRAR